MNKAIVMGRLTRDPEVRYSQGERQMAIARYTLAVDRRGRREGGEQQTADFIPCVAFDRAAEFAEKYLHQGLRILVTGRIQTGSYTNREGQKVYTTEIIVEDQEFADGRQQERTYGDENAPAQPAQPGIPEQAYDGPAQPAPRRQQPQGYAPAQPQAAAPAQPAQRRARRPMPQPEEFDGQYQ